MTTVKILNDTQKESIYNGFLTGGSKRHLARQFNVSARTIGRVIEEKLTKHSNNSKPKMIGSESFITVINEGKVYTVDSSHKRFDKALESVKNGDIQQVINLISVPDAIRVYSNGDIKIIGDKVMYRDIVFDTEITKRIIREMYNDRPYNHLLAFFERLMKNPSRDAVYQLYGFLSHNDIQIDNDGYILAWKRVNLNFRDFYSDTYDNSPGQIVSMPRNMVDEDKTKTCSVGLHVCSEKYLPFYYGGRGYVVQCKIDPADVVAIPNDYHCAKMRVCRYEVVEERTGYNI